MIEPCLGRIELADLGLDQGGHLLVKRALQAVPVNTPVAVYGSAPELAIHLRGWCRAQGHDIEIAHNTGGPVAVIYRGSPEVGRWLGAESTGNAVVPEKHASASWGVAGRSATVEAGVPAFDFPLDVRAEVWAKEAARLYAQAAAAQWNPATAIPWDEPFDLLDEVEDAIVQVMTYLIENETVALLIPARFASQIHPHFREVMQLLAIQAADEARHIEVFTRRALLRRTKLGLSTVGGQASLKTLIDEPDFALSAMLLSVLGEGSFLSLLSFLHQYAPDPVTSEIARLVAQDEARHVAVGVAHLACHVKEDPVLLERLAEAIEHRHDVLANTAGLNEEVFDSLILFAAGSWRPEALRAGWEKMQILIADMNQGRVRRLCKIGFDQQKAIALSALHTRNFM